MKSKRLFIVTIATLVGMFVNINHFFVPLFDNV